MRSICLVLVVIACCAMITPAHAQHSSGGTNAPCSCQQHHRGHVAAPCGVRQFGGVPGCCKSAPSCCDDIWAGYCQEKAARRARFQRSVCVQKATCCPNHAHGYATASRVQQPTSARYAVVGLSKPTKAPPKTTARR